jgi:uncharacterized protein YjbI with pentapeptide repeats
VGGLPRWTVPVVAAVVLVVAGVVLVLLWQWIDRLALRDMEKKAAAHLEAVKVASAFVVGGGGVFALYLAVRRQRTQEQELATRRAELAHTEQVAQDNRLLAERTAAATAAHHERLEGDAAARRVTELYTKASEQLGSDKAPVRLAGLYALERLAQDHPEQRQTIVNMLCAYLRMPYTLPAKDAPADDTDEKLVLAHQDRVQEREVRLTAQRILETHLRPGENSKHPAGTFWAEIDLDLSGAILIDFTLWSGHARHVYFRSATFIGHAYFGATIFTGDADFRSAIFTGGTYFRSATFTGEAHFESARFDSNAYFESATFTRGAFFGSVSFAGDRYVGVDDAGPRTDFRGARFARGVPVEVRLFLEEPG